MPISAVQSTGDARPPLKYTTAAVRFGLTELAEVSGGLADLRSVGFSQHHRYAVLPQAA